MPAPLPKRVSCAALTPLISSATSPQDRSRLTRTLSIARKIAPVSNRKIRLGRSRGSASAGFAELTYPGMKLSGVRSSHTSICNAAFPITSRFPFKPVIVEVAMGRHGTSRNRALISRVRPLQLSKRACRSESRAANRAFRSKLEMLTPIASVRPILGRQIF